jgi:hypothetical protein
MLAESSPYPKNRGRQSNYPMVHCPDSLVKRYEIAVIQVDKETLKVLRDRAANALAKKCLASALVILIDKSVARREEKPNDNS